MSELEYLLKRKQSLASWSDRRQAEAAHFADSHRDLLPRRITNAQLYGLGNVVRSARRYGDIERFIRHQAEKAERAGRLDVQDYWNDLKDALGKLRSEAQTLLRTLPLPAGMDNWEALDALHRELAELYVQHLIAHSLYWTPAQEESGRRER
ncbi:MAG: hypothetical protein J7555_09825 [Chloroflexi bacterium]|jgi:hypothetical protein|nr:hypothetical protein [Chloroflexota bacterium]